MGKGILITALLAAVINASTALTALWTGEGVSTFTDINPVQYGVVVLGFIITLAQNMKNNDTRRALGEKE